MDRVHAAIQKARRLAAETPDGWDSAAPRQSGVASHDAAWASLPTFAPDAEELERLRVVDEDAGLPEAAAFASLRGKVLRIMKARGWRTLGVTSPTSGCGKTTITLNLGFGIGRAGSARAALLDVDLHRAMLSRSLGLEVASPISQAFAGAASIVGSLVRPLPTLAVGVGTQSDSRRVGNVLHGPAAGAAMRDLKARLKPDIIICDLPPLLEIDDALAFAPHLDGILLVCAAERSRPDELQLCQTELAGRCELLGIVLNKCRYDER